MEESKSYRLFLRMENVTSVTNKNEAAKRQDHQVLKGSYIYIDTHIYSYSSYSKFAKKNVCRAVAYHLLAARGPAVFVHPMALFSVLRIPISRSEHQKSCCSQVISWKNITHQESSKIISYIAVSCLSHFVKKISPRTKDIPEAVDKPQNIAKKTDDCQYVPSYQPPAKLIFHDLVLNFGQATGVSGCLGDLSRFSREMVVCFFSAEAILFRSL